MPTYEREGRGKLITRATQADIDQARALGNQYDPDIYGRFCWLTRDYGGEGRALTLSKARLGLFVESVLRNRGEITQFHAMAPEYRNSYVQASVRLTVQARLIVMEETGITLENPPVLRVNTA